MHWRWTQFLWLYTTLLSLQVGSELRATLKDLPVNVVATYDADKPELAVTENMPEGGAPHGSTQASVGRRRGCAVVLFGALLFCGHLGFGTWFVRNWARAACLQVVVSGR